ncbi:MAG: protoporphyrin/coproporphyrin ferrochelatase [Frankiaceae bacterium]|nr:protoporphyrin/coproporphyrin ferrochelatase [Frankiaceae bacterium]
MTVGVLVMAYGTPLDHDDIETYYTDIRRGRPPTAAQLAALTSRYDALGGTFPLRAATEQQVAAIHAELEHLAPGGFSVTLGTKHSVPSIEDGVRELVSGGAERVVGLVLAPHYSRFSVGEYADRAAKAGAEAGVRVDTIEDWHRLPAYIEFLDRAVRETLATLPLESEVVFTAHSLPQRILDAGDPYPGQLAETAATVAGRAALQRWSVAWQSAGRTPEPWLGPDILDVISDRAAAGVHGLVVCACGFVADHLEVAYDLDIEAKALADSLALPFARTSSVGADPAVMTALAALVAAR